MPELRAWGPGPARGLRSGQAPQEEGALQAAVCVRLKKEQTATETSNRTRPPSHRQLLGCHFQVCFSAVLPKTRRRWLRRKHRPPPERHSGKPCPDCRGYHVSSQAACPPHNRLGSAESSGPRQHVVHKLEGMLASPGFPGFPGQAGLFSSPVPPAGWAQDLGGDRKDPSGSGSETETLVLHVKQPVGVLPVWLSG